MLVRVLFTLHIAFVVFNARLFLAGSAANQLQKSALLAAGISAVLTRKLNQNAVFCVSAIMVTTVASALFSDFGGLSVSRYFQGAYSLLTVLLPLCVFYTAADYRFFIRLISWSPLACVLIGVLYDAVGLHTLFYTDFLGVSRLQGSTISSGLGAIGWIGCIAAMMASNTINRKYYIVLGVNFLILLLSAARMPFACAAFVCFVMFYTQHIKRISSFAGSTILLLGLCGAAYIAIGDRIVNRFASDSGSGRDLIWASLKAVLDAYPYFGIGLGHQILVIPESVQQRAVTIAAHNEYLRLALETGYFGAYTIFTLYIFIFIWLWLSYRIYRNISFICTVLSFFVFCITDNVISSNTSFFCFMLAMGYPVLLMEQDAMNLRKRIKPQSFPISEFGYRGSAPGAVDQRAS